MLQKPIVDLAELLLPISLFLGVHCSQSKQLQNRKDRAGNHKRDSRTSHVVSNRTDFVHLVEITVGVTHGVLPGQE
jgi:hypothetical protein